MRPKLVRKIEPIYYVRPDAEADEEGPLSLEMLREMAEMGDVSPETWFRLEEETEYRRLGEDGPLAADLWPDDEPFDPETAAVAIETSFEEEPDPEESEGVEVADLLRANVDRDQELREASGEPEGGTDWAGLLAYKWLAVRWILGLFFLWKGISVWAGINDDGSEVFVLDFLVGLVLIGAALALTLSETVALVTAPVVRFFEALMQGSGGGGGADYWTADALLAQGDYRLALAEYRRIANDHPREVEAYLKGIRAARALENEKEEERFRELALKNLKSDQDRNLFLASLERMN
ncbi:MAG TPA: hypothetical protein VK041_02170 [Opitutales bacterium]|nr:hypothetical protein [Opitutales bacterium]